MTVTAVLSLGSNVDPHRHLAGALEELEARFGPLRRSPVYGSAAVGFSGESFLNLAVAFETAEDPAAIHAWLRALEERHGRVRGGPRFADRPLDVDLVLYGDRVGDGPPALPRDEIARYAFVLRPLADLWPDGRHPVTGERYADLWAAFADPEQSLWPASL